MNSESDETKINHKTYENMKMWKYEKGEQCGKGEKGEKGDTCEKDKKCENFTVNGVYKMLRKILHKCPQSFAPKP